MNKKTHTYPSGKKEVLFEAFCNVCGKNRGYVKKKKINKSCRTCAGIKVGKFNTGKIGPNKGKIFSKCVRQKMSDAKKNYVPWNKGKKELRYEVRY